MGVFRVLPLSSLACGPGGQDDADRPEGVPAVHRGRPPSSGEGPTPRKTASASSTAMHAVRRRPTAALSGHGLPLHRRQLCEQPVLGRERNAFPGHCSLKDFDEGIEFGKGDAVVGVD